MGKEQKGQFIQIDPMILGKKLKAFSQSKGNLKLWTKDGEALSFSFSNKDSSFQGTRPQLTLLADDFKKNHPESGEVFFCFEVEHVKYFSKGSINSSEENTISVDCDELLFKLDQRKRTRISTFPEYEVFSYLKIDYPGSDEDNILVLNRPKDDLLGFFKNFQKEAVKNKFNKGTPFDKEFFDNLIGFRVLDLADNGMSFLVNEREKDFITNLEDALSMVLSLDGKKTELEECKLIYLIPFIYEKAEAVPMYKLGIQFREIPGLINIEAKTFEESTEVIKNFEKFMD